MIPSLGQVDFVQGTSRCRRRGNEGFSINFDLMVDHGRNMKRISQSGLKALVVVVIVELVAVEPVEVTVEVVDPELVEVMVLAIVVLLVVVAFVV
jgi:hypothetical protein